MVASLTSPADLANLAFARMGYKMRVGSLYDGSQGAKTALDVYAQTRDELLRENDWDFAEGNAALALLKQAPATGYIPPIFWNQTDYPPMGWKFEYTYPIDCLKVRAVKRRGLFAVNFDPQPILFKVVNDSSYTPARRVLVTQIPDALLVYTRQVTDPTTWDVGFVDGFAARLAKVLGPALVGLEATKAVMVDDAQSVDKAETEHG